MRRSTPSVFAPGRLPPLESAFGGAPAAAVVEALAPFATPARVARLGEVAAGRVGSLTVLMDAPYDPHNGGALVRTLDALGVHALHVVELADRPFLIAPTVTRGAHKWVELHAHADVPAATARLRAAGFVLVAAHAGGELVPADLAALPRACVVVGNEREGIRDELLGACDRSVRVPMRGFAESLNLSVTAAILLSHALAGRAGDLDADERARFVARGLLLTVPGSVTILRERGLVPRDVDPVEAWRNPRPAPAPRPGQQHRNARRRARTAAGGEGA
jgi:tRNA (guanosine-2'-O-)-methyltransferase